ncbi:Cupredoxin [Corchorus olitorius]|uniref:Cupredoxin n=1 Tax=Corchorus olitorius TaxID=93759 RepID=A0A1R3G2Y7_9ROSI|nr:Cupredoxin [Corchorus olitorius]
MALSRFLTLFLIHIALLLGFCFAEDPFVFYNFEVIAINKQFPGPTINATTNYNVVVNVRNKLDESLLMHWSGIQQRRSSWQDGLPGTNCPIPPKWNWTYQFQVKDQIGSFFYFPSLHFQRAAGGFGGFIINNRNIIPIPFNTPDGDITILIGDWYTRNHSGKLIAFECTIWNVSASGARPNPQGSFRYGSINVTEIYVLKNKPPVTINGKKRTTLNGISFVNPATPIRLADQFKVKGVYKLDFPKRPLTGPPKMETSIINGTYRGFMEVILQNNDTKVQTYHMSGYAFFVVGMDYGEWSENSRGTYNKWDGIARSTIQVYPGAWTAILISLDNVGVWNLRTENLDSWYLGQETYVRIVNPEATNKTELPVPDNALYCGALSKLQKPQDINLATSITGGSKLFSTMLMIASALLFLSR